MPFEPSDVYLVAVILLLAWFVINYIDGGGGGRRARVPLVP
jgi:hypothetical protein